LRRKEKVVSHRDDQIEGLASCCISVPRLKCARQPRLEKMKLKDGSQEKFDDADNGMSEFRVSKRALEISCT
jgi:hypothetical protein